MRALVPGAAKPEWRFPSDEIVPSPPPGYVVSFRHFHERGFGMPGFGMPHNKFMRGLLHYYGA